MQYYSGLILRFKKILYAGISHQLKLLIATNSGDECDRLESDSTVLIES